MASEPAPAFSPRFTSLLLVLLVIPFALKSLTTAVPFPAVLFPTGPSKIAVHDGQAEFTYVSIEGYDDVGRPMPVDVRRLMAPISASLVFGIADSEFGQGQALTQTVSLKRLKWGIDLPRWAHARASQDQARQWLGDRLRRQGLSPDRILVRLDAVTVEMRSGVELSRTVISEKAIALR